MMKDKEKEQKKDRKYCNWQNIEWIFSFCGH